MAAVKEFPTLSVYSHRTSDDPQEAIGVVAAKSTDASKLTVPLQMAVAAIIGALSMSAFYYSGNQATTTSIAAIASDMRLLTQTVENLRKEMDEREKNRDRVEIERQKAFDAQIRALDAKIDSTGMRNANLNLSQALQQAQRK